VSQSSNQQEAITSLSSQHLGPTFGLTGPLSEVSIVSDFKLTQFYLNVFPLNFFSYENKNNNVSGEQSAAGAWG
jgi:hypothetical protein